MESLPFSNRVLYPKLKTYDGLMGKIKLASPFIYLGVEVEAENVSHFYSQYSIPGSWRIVEDGSLKVHGSEYVTVPIKFKYIEMELRRLFDAIPKAEFSPRTSIHIHVNSRDFTDQELFRFLVLYLIFERNLYKFAGDRWLNNFCVPIHSSPGNIGTILRHCHGNVLSNISWCKYYGLNLLPLLGEEGSSCRYGTIEFRHMIGNNDVEYIMNWCNLILSLKLAAKSCTNEFLMSSLLMNETTSLAFIDLIFKDWATHIASMPMASQMIEESSLATKIYLAQAGILSN